jgi:hypothetical protein
MPITMNKNELKAWGRLRSRGFWHFVIVRGLVCWGILGGLMFSVLLWIVMGRVVFPDGELSIWSVLSVSMVGWPLSGLLLSPVLWVMCERVYKKAAEADSAKSD